jgi:vancomycin resistance protein YoaR
MFFTITPLHTIFMGKGGFFMPKKVWVKILFSISIFSVLLISGYATSGIIPTNVFMEEIDISGLSIEKAGKKVQDNLSKIFFTYKTFSCSLSPEELGINIDYHKSFNNLKNRTIWQKVLMNFQETHFVLEKTYDENKMEDALIAISNGVSIPPKDAYLEMEGTKIVEKPGTWGTKVDIELLKSIIIKGNLKNKYLIPVRSVEPKITVADLKELKPNILLAQYTTKFVKNPNRTENIRIACEAIKKTLIPPGEIFSFNQVVGPREEEKGYLNAMVILGGDFIPGIGGGICQVSSTLYNAVLLAGLEIVERYPHSLRIDYVPLGRDATVTYGIKDFKFKNNTPGYLLIDYNIVGQELTLSIYGTKDWTETIKVIDIPHHIIKIIEAPVQTIISTGLAPGESKVKSSGRPGYVVNTFRIIEIKGKPQKEFLAKDYYQPVPRVIEKAAF